MVPGEVSLGVAQGDECTTVVHGVPPPFLVLMERQPQPTAPLGWGGDVGP